MKKRELSKGFREAVDAAFPIGRPPSKVTSSDTPDCVEITEWLANKSWSTIPADLLDRLHGDLPLYTGEYFRYILPAYLLRAYETEDRSFALDIVFALENRSLHSSEFSKFSAEQRKIIRRFLDWADKLGIGEAGKTLLNW